MMFALPGSAYLYQGEELGLPEHTTLSRQVRQDPTYFRHNGTVMGRDGCRIPLPWVAGAPGLGFGPSEQTWLPQPDSYAPLAADVQAGVKGSTLELYRAALAGRRARSLGLGELAWVDGFGSDTVAFENNGLVCVTNFGAASVVLPAQADIVLASGDLVDDAVGTDQTVWFTRD